MAEDWVGLADAIKHLRAELNAALQEGKDDELRFELGPVEMEFHLEVGREGEGEAGVRFWVVSVGGKAGASSSSTHRVTLTMTPKTRAGGTLQIGSVE